MDNCSKRYTSRKEERLSIMHSGQQWDCKSFGAIPEPFFHFDFILKQVVTLRH